MAHGLNPALVRLCMTCELRMVFTFVLEKENTAKAAWGPQSLKCLLSDPLQKSMRRHRGDSWQVKLPCLGLQVRKWELLKLRNLKRGSKGP